MMDNAEIDLVQAELELATARRERNEARETLRQQADVLAAALSAARGEAVPEAVREHAVVREVLALHVRFRAWAAAAHRALAWFGYTDIAMVDEPDEAMWTAVYDATADRAADNAAIRRCREEIRAAHRALDDHAPYERDGRMLTPAERIEIALAREATP